MTLTEIKKELYKRDIKAKLDVVKKGFLYYSTDPIKMDGYSLELCPIVHFIVPFDDIGDGLFFPEMPAKHLIRYIYPTENQPPKQL